jgi:hypothetical protein
MSKIKTVEEMMERINNADDLTSKCRYRIGVLVEHFEHLSGKEGGFGFDDHVLWALGIKEICSDVARGLSEADELIFRMGDHLKLYSLDMEKVKKENKYRKSIGIDEPLEAAEEAG